jgi:hypothetical protein
LKGDSDAIEEALDAEQDSSDSEDTTTSDFVASEDELASGRFADSRRLRRILSDIKDDIDSLFQVSLLLKRPGFDRRYLRSTGKSDFDSRIAHHFNSDVSHVTEKILQWNQLENLANDQQPVATPELIDLRKLEKKVSGHQQELIRRLASANTRRREQLLYWFRHPDQPPPEFGVHEVLGKVHEDRTEVDSQGQVSTAAKDTFTIAAASDVYRATKMVGPTRTEYSESTTSNNNSSRVPDVPKAAFENDSFECPFCHAMLDSSEMQSRTQWK